MNTDIYWQSPARTVAEQEALLGNPRIPSGAHYSDEFYRSIAALHLAYEYVGFLDHTVVCMDSVDFFGRRFVNIFAFEGGPIIFDRDAQLLLGSLQTVQMKRCGGTDFYAPCLPGLVEIDTYSSLPWVHVEGQYVPLLCGTSPCEWEGAFGMNAADWVPRYASEAESEQDAARAQVLGRLGRDLFNRASSVLDPMVRWSVPLSESYQDDSFCEVIWEEPVDLGKLDTIISK